MAQTTPSESVRCRPWCFRLQMNPRATRNKSPCKEVVLILAPLVCSCGHPTECRSSIQEREVGLHPGIVLDCHLAVSRPLRETLPSPSRTAFPACGILPPPRSGQASVDETEHFPQNREPRVATKVFGIIPNTVRLSSGLSIQLRRNPPPLIDWCRLHR